MKKLIKTSALISLFFVYAASGQTFKPQQITFFEKKVRPILAEHCFECHSAKSKKLQGGLRLDNRTDIIKGGTSGKPIVSFKERPYQSKLLKVARLKKGDDYRHPPMVKPLSGIEIKSLVSWVQMKLPFPEATEPNAFKEEKTVGAWKKKFDWEKAGKYWAFRKPIVRKAPQPKQVNWARSDIDRFILFKLEASELRPSQDATKGTLIRRIYFDLIGLPPTPDQMKSFLGDDSIKAFEKVVDELLGSRQFGERWGRHWMDVARYAESTGMERNFTYPHAWKYRDYVIKSFNEDKPYNRFIKEQVAGDLMVSKDPKQEAERLVATGFLAMGPKSLNQKDKRIFTMDIVDEQIDVATRATLGLSIACARCHDHKFDPIPTEDYYALAGIFRSTKTHYGTAKGNGNRQTGSLIPMGKNAKEMKAELEQYNREMATLGKQLKKAQKQLQVLKRKKNEEGMRAKMDECAEDVRETSAQLKQMKKNSPKAPQYAMGVQDGKDLVNVRVHLRGDVDTLGATIQRGYLTALPIKEASLPKIEESGRLQLAEWLTHEENPLAARVMVNRIWHHIFGQGIVRTVDNFGSSGEAPSHPELLDYLALHFQANGWSVKKAIREIVLSRTYQLASSQNADNFKKDPENKLLWRANVRRLEAEALRDAMLSASGELDVEPVKGSAVAKAGNGNVGRGVTIPRDSLENVSHRSVYLPIVRNLLPEFLRAFDFAEPSMIVGRRQETTVPSQALFLLNSPFVIKQASAMAKNLLAEGKSAPETLVEKAYERTLSRPPSEEELLQAMKFHQIASSAKGELDSSDALAHLCHALFASAEFRYLD
jgi:cytochrome c553